LLDGGVVLRFLLAMRIPDESDRKSSNRAGMTDLMRAKRLVKRLRAKQAPRGELAGDAWMHVQKPAAGCSCRWSRAW